MPKMGEKIRQQLEELGSKLLDSPPSTKDSIIKLLKCTSRSGEISTEDLIGCRIKVWWPMDKMFYEGVVKSFDSQKKKHVVLYDDGDVEVLRLDREKWELVLKGKKSGKQSTTLKSPRLSGKSAEQKKSVTGLRQKENVAEISPPSPAKRKRTPRKNVKREKNWLSESEGVPMRRKTLEHPAMSSVDDLCSGHKLNDRPDADPLQPPWDRHFSTQTEPVRAGLGKGRLLGAGYTPVAEHLLEDGSSQSMPSSSTSTASPSPFSELKVRNRELEQELMQNKAELDQMNSRVVALENMIRSFMGCSAGQSSKSSGPSACTAGSATGTATGLLASIHERHVSRASDQHPHLYPHSYTQYCDPVGSSEHPSQP